MEEEEWGAFTNNNDTEEIKESNNGSESGNIGASDVPNETAESITEEEAKVDLIENIVVEENVTINLAGEKDIEITENVEAVVEEPVEINTLDSIINMSREAQLGKML